MECDILAPCAADGALSQSNSPLIQAKVIIEGANGPTTFKGDTVFNERGVTVIPDMLANVGGVTVSYFEWLKNLDHVNPGRMTKKLKENQNLNLIKILGYKFPKKSPLLKELEGAREIDLVYSGLEEIMVTATRENWAYAMKKNLSLRDACMANSLKKLSSRFEESGLML